MIKADEEKQWELISKHIEEEKCILIIGPEILLDNSDKTVNQLLKELLENNKTDHHYFSDDEFFSFSLDMEKEYALMDIKKFYSEIQPLPIHELISQIPLHLIISLSPDLVLKKHFDSKGLPCSFDFYNKEQNPRILDKPTSNKPLIYNLFGSIDTEGSFILTYDDLFDYLIAIFGKFELPLELKSQLKSARSLLILGCPFEKWYFKLLLRLLYLQEIKVKYAGMNMRPLLAQTKNFYIDEFNMNFLGYSSYEIIENIHNKFKGNPKLRTKATASFSDKPEIFVSYSWGGESENVVNRIYDLLTGKGYKLIRDKIDLGYKGNIMQFMQNIGKGKYIVVIISDKYLKSENCMFEMLEIKKNGNVYERIFPVVIHDANIYDEISRIDYLNYWDEKIRQLNEKYNDVQNKAGTGRIVEKINQYNDIRRIIDEITDMLREMNTHSLAMLMDSDFKELIQAIDKKMSTDFDIHMISPVNT